MFIGVPDMVFDVVTCANRRNLATLPDLREFLISIGLRRWRIFTVFPSGRAAHDPDMRLTAEEFDRVMDFIAVTRQDGRIRLDYGCEGFLGGYEGKVRDYLFRCDAGLSCASILSNGDIAACASIRSDYSLSEVPRPQLDEGLRRPLRQLPVFPLLSRRLDAPAGGRRHPPSRHVQDG